MKIILFPLLILLSVLYGVAVFFKRTFYLKDILLRREVSVPVVSVGNLTVGGTGKTPVVSYLIRFFSDQGLKVGVVSRGYKGDFKGIQRVDLKKEGNFGDEPMMLAARFPQVPIYVGRDKSQACQMLLEKESANGSVDMIIVDDGFQHWRLKRDRDIVLLDSTKSCEIFFGEYALLPLGKGREGFSQLRRSDVVFLTKVGWGEEKSLQNIRERLSCYPVPVVEWKFALSGLRDIMTGEMVSERDLQRMKDDKWGLASGIGSPKSFEEAVKKDLNFKVAWHKVYADHYNFKLEDLNKLLERADSTGVKGILISEKDSIKWRRHTEMLKSQVKGQMGNILVAELEISPCSSVDWKNVLAHNLSL